MRYSIIVWILLFLRPLGPDAAAQSVNWQKICNLKDVQTVAINQSGTIFVASMDSLVRSTDNGKHWVRLPVPSPEWLSIAIDSGGTVYAASGGGIRRSTDNGDTWTSVSTAFGRGMVCSPAGHVFVLAGDTVNGILRSTDRGSTWKKVFSGQEDFVLVGLSGEIIVTGSGASAVASTDDGDTWHPYAHGLTCLACLSNGVMIGGTGLSHSPGARVYYGQPYIFRSTDNGTRWEIADSVNVCSIASDAAGRVYAGVSPWGLFGSSFDLDRSNRGGIIVSSDNGLHWTPLNAGLTAHSVTSLARSSHGTVIAGTDEGVFSCASATPIDIYGHDLYVSMQGAADNTGLSPSVPIRSIADALSRIEADSLHPRSIHIASGKYGLEQSDEPRTVYLKSFLTLAGESKDGTVIEGVQFLSQYASRLCMEKLSLRNGNVYLSGSSGILRYISISGRNATGGPGIGLASSSGTIENVDISKVTDEAGILMYGSSPVLRHVSIHHNSGWLCGGIRIEEGSSPVLANVTIANNTGGEMGGMICNDGSNPVLVNTIVWNNSKPEIEQRSFTNGDCSFTFSHCDIHGGNEGIHLVNFGTGVATTKWLDGNVNAEPLFVDTSGGDYHLQQGSLCIDAGTALLVFGDTLLKLESNEFTGSAPDMGSFEYGISTDVRSAPSMTESYTLAQNYPNPFNPTTVISGQWTADSEVRLVVYDLLGREIAVLANGRYPAGRYTFT
ncbi:MAG TPA: right-handed parallel beta-helix repeat-containing protein, partial [Bacteroidota bacterium]|nr:right-handed parallel beta-helix repeat-containing protein [Bacteroidota bacterium]